MFHSKNRQQTSDFYPSKPWGIEMGPRASSA